MRIGNSVVVELLDVVDDDRTGSELFVDQRTELATEAEGAVRGGPAQEPRLAEPRGSLEQRDNRARRVAEPGQHSCSGQAKVHRRLSARRW